MAQSDAADKVSENSTNLQIERVFVNTGVFEQNVSLALGKKLN